MDIPKFVHPPRDLPKLPLMEDLELDRADLDLVPVPKVELAWESGPEPEPAYSSVATTPFLMSRSGSPSRSLASSRPASALPRSPSPVGTMTPQEPSRAPTPARVSVRGETSACLHRFKVYIQNCDPLVLFSFSCVSGDEPPMVSGDGPPLGSGEASKWSDVLDVDAGKPRVWMNFEKPFAELPPLFIPPEPELVGNQAQRQRVDANPQLLY